MNPKEKQFSLNHEASRKQFRISLLTLVTFVLLYTHTSVIGATPASDKAADAAYDDGWQTGDNGGSGWGGGWVLSAPGSANARFGIGDSGSNGDGDTCPPLGDINTPQVPAGRAWAIFPFSQGDSVRPDAWGIRPFDGPLAVGQTFNVDFDNGFLGGGPDSSVSLNNASGFPVWRFTPFFDQNYVFWDGGNNRDTGIARTDEGLRIAFTLTSPNTFSLKVTTLCPDQYFLFTGSLFDQPGDDAPTSVVLLNGTGGPSPANTAFFNSISITAGENTPPVAGDQSVTTTVDTPVVITLTATDADGNPLTYQIVTPPSHGVLSGATPNLSYTSDIGYSGPDSFTFKANDGQADSNIATVDIRVAPILLMFPLNGLTPYTASIVSVFDHSMMQSYTCDGLVRSYTGELGDRNPDVKNPKCKDHPGYAQAGNAPFYVNGGYVGAGSDIFHLNYDGHPGIDYRAGFGTEVNAATSGRVRYPTLDELKSEGIYIGGDPDVFNALELDPGNGYKLYYLHLSTHRRTISLHLTSSVTGQDFIATPQTGTPSRSSPGHLTKDQSLSITGRITVGGVGLSGVTVELHGFMETGGGVGGSGCVITGKTEGDGNYRFSGLSRGWYHIRCVLQGYSFRMANPNPDTVPDGTFVQAGQFIGRTGNAGPCTPPHLHFEVQKQGNSGFIPVDPYGWDGEKTDCDRKTGDPYGCFPSIGEPNINVNLWAHQPLIRASSPAATTTGQPFDLTITGNGFDQNVMEKFAMLQNNIFVEVSTQERQVLSHSGSELLVRVKLAAGNYFVHVANSDGRRSNWRKLVVQ